MDNPKRTQHVLEPHWRISNVGYSLIMIAFGLVFGLASTQFNLPHSVPEFLFYAFGNGLACLFFDIGAVIATFGLWTFGASALRLMNPSIKLVISTKRAPPGTEIKMDWKIIGSKKGLQQFSVFLVGKEIATYRVGTSTSTAENEFYRKPLLVVDHRQEFRGGSTNFKIPQEAVPSFKSNNNEVKWEIQAQGVIANWPDIDDHYYFKVAYFDLAEGRQAYDRAQ